MVFATQKLCKNLTTVYFVPVNLSCFPVLDITVPSFSQILICRLVVKDQGKDVVKSKVEEAQSP
jgi:hypothetical protein